MAGVGDGPGAALRTLLGAALGAAVAGGLYLVVWLVTRGGFGFGDVRFAPLVGAATAVPTFTMLLWALFLGSLVGGVVGIIRLAPAPTGSVPVCAGDGRRGLPGSARRACPRIQRLTASSAVRT